MVVQSQAKECLRISAVLVSQALQKNTTDADLEHLNLVVSWVQKSCQEAQTYQNCASNWIVSFP
jgi:hypothetical protein